MIIELHATPGEVMRAVEALETHARDSGVPANLIFGLTLALEECGSNIVNHAFQRDAQKTFQVEIDRRKDSYVIELRDHGPAFDPTHAPERETAPDEDDLPGGWGIQLVRRYIDEILYTRDRDENILTLIKQLPESI